MGVYVQAQWIREFLAPAALQLDPDAEDIAIVASFRARTLPVRVLALAVLTAVCAVTGACATPAAPHSTPSTSASAATGAVPATARVSAAVPKGAAAKDMDNQSPASGMTLHRYFYAVPTGRADPRQNWMDLYLPPRRGKVPLVVLIHGGAWQAKIGAGTFATFARRLAERGLGVVNIEYRRVGNGGGWPTTFVDVAAAMDAIPDLAKAYPQLELRNAVVVGHSAGAQLAVWASTRHELRSDEVGASPVFRPTTVVSLAGPLDMRRAVEMGDTRIVRVLGGTPDEVPDRYASVDPIQNLDPQTPVIAIAGTSDRVVPHVLSQDYVAADAKAGGRAQAIIMPGQTHASLVDPKSKAFAQILELITRITNDIHANGS